MFNLDVFHGGLSKLHSRWKLVDLIRNTGGMAVRPLDPLVARQRLGLALKSLREAARPAITLQVASERVGRKHSWLSLVEQGKTLIRPGEVEVLLGFYRAKARVSAEIMDLARMAGSTRQSTMYRDFGDVIDSGFDTLLRLEAHADVIRTFECQAIPALLQTKEYASAVAAALRPDEPDEVTQRANLRMQRQGILDAESPPRVECVIAEGALLQEVGGRAVMADQIRHILDRATSGVTVRVLPHSAGAYAAMNGAFVLLTLPPLPAFIADGPEIVAYQDTLLGCVYHREPRQVGEFEHLWRDLVAKSLDESKSIECLHNVLEVMSRPPEK